MKRDMDTVRAILLSLADNDALPPAEEIGEEQLAYHIWILEEADLVSYHSRYLSSGGVPKVSLRLTWQGNEFLEASRNPNTWEKAKKVVLEKSGALSFEVLKAVLVKISTDVALGGIAS